jgi:hypothetical protein
MWHILVVEGDGVHGLSILDLTPSRSNVFSLPVFCCLEGERKV